MAIRTESLSKRSTAIHDNHTQVNIAAAFRAIQADLALHQAALAALTAKLDADVGVTDVNYNSLITPAATFVLSSKP